MRYEALQFFWISVMLFAICTALIATNFRRWRRREPGLASFLMAVGAAGTLGSLPGMVIQVYEWGVGAHITKSVPPLALIVMYQIVGLGVVSLAWYMRRRPGVMPKIFFVLALIIGAFTTTAVVTLAYTSFYL